MSRSLQGFKTKESFCINPEKKHRKRYVFRHL